MPGSKSLYHKIQEVLEQARRSTPIDLRDLERIIEESGADAFYTRQYDKKRDRHVDLPSTKVIRKTVRICRNLDLLTEEGVLTQFGRDALRKLKFNTVLSQRVRHYLLTAGVDVDALNKHVDGLLRNRPPVLPTSTALWEISKCSLPLAMFSRLLTLLSHADAASSTQQKVYLHFN
jgi:hypothetical protein